MDDAGGLRLDTIDGDQAAERLESRDAEAPRAPRGGGGTVGPLSWVLAAVCIQSKNENINAFGMNVMQNYQTEFNFFGPGGTARPSGCVYLFAFSN